MRVRVRVYVLRYKRTFESEVVGWTAATVLALALAFEVACAAADVVGTAAAGVVVPRAAPVAVGAAATVLVAAAAATVAGVLLFWFWFWFWFWSLFVSWAGLDLGVVAAAAGVVF